MSTDRRKKYLAIGAALCLLVLILDRTLLSPLLSGYQEQGRRVQLLTTEVAKAENAADYAARWRQRVDDYRRNALPHDRSAAENEVIQCLREWEERAGVDLVSMRTQWQDADDTWPVLDVRLAGKGQLETIARFVYAVETANLPLRTRQLSVSASASAGGVQELSMSLHLQAILWGDGTKGDRSEPETGAPAS